MGNSWTLLRLHVQRPGRIVTPDLLLTGATIARAGCPDAVIAVQRLLLAPAIQLEPGEWTVAPALASVRAMEIYHVPAVALANDGRLAWIFLARQALAAADSDAAPHVLLDGEATSELATDCLADAGVTARIMLGRAEPRGTRASVVLSARAGTSTLPETRIALESIT